MGEADPVPPDALPFEDFLRDNPWVEHLINGIEAKRITEFSEDPSDLVFARQFNTRINKNIAGIKEYFPKAEEYTHIQAAMTILKQVVGASGEQIQPTEEMFQGTDIYSWEQLSGKTAWFDVVMHLVASSVSSANIDKIRRQGKL